MDKEFTEASRRTYGNGSTHIFSAAYMALQDFERTADTLNDARSGYADATTTLNRAVAAEIMAGAKLVETLIAHYGGEDKLPSAMRLHDATLLIDFDEEDGYSVRIVKSPSICDLYRIEDAADERVAA